MAATMMSGIAMMRTLVTDSSSVARYLRAFGEPTDAPAACPAVGPLVEERRPAPESLGDVA
ncbi:MAG TPA: hypothetical protein VK540_21070 [Polyangiaceae bacterium]|nr:hypothetical protein [Polyangiaceae bacterium]